MSERRLAYLDALGVDVWLTRAPAAPTPSAGGGPRAVSAPPKRAPSADPGAAQRVAPPTAIVRRPVGDVSAFDWDTLRDKVASCQACGLCESRTQTVFGTGDRAARWLIVGEAPGADEDRLGEPFVGRAGQLLDAMLLAAGYSREQVYIANILKCRPPDNRDPKADEVAQCLPYLARQIALLQPQLIIAVGRVAAQRLLDSTAALGKLRGQVHSYGETAPIPLLATYHPAYLLRSPSYKRKAWEDLVFARRLTEEMVH